MLRFRIPSLAIAASLALVGCACGTGNPAESPVRTVVVPDVLGLYGDVAEGLMTNAGFDLVFETGPEAVLRTSLWVVNDQDPAPGVERPEGSVVTLDFYHPEDAHGPRAIRLVLDAESDPTAIRARTTATLAELDAREVCVERTWAAGGGPNGEAPGASAGYIVVTFPEETLSAVQEGTCADFIPSLA